LQCFCGSRSPTRQPPRKIFPFVFSSIPSGPGRPYTMGTTSRLAHFGQG
jgi:hypothetical protein